MPLGKNVRKNMVEITDAHPDWSRKRRLAASLNASRERSAPRRIKRRVKKYVRKKR